jgi:hypothetical protein
LIWLLLSIAAMLFLSLVGASVVSGGLLGFGFSPDAPGKSSAYAGWLVGGLTMVGVLASLAVNSLRAQPQDQPLDFSGFFRAMLYPQTFISLCVSPVVFFGALIALDGKELGPAVYLAAFQNGFFWQRILDTKKNEADQ